MEDEEFEMQMADEEYEVVLECDSPYSGEEDDSEEEDAGATGRIIVRGAQPHLFEPPARNQKTDLAQNDLEERFRGRREHLDW